MGFEYRDEFIASTATALWPSGQVDSRDHKVPQDIAFLRTFGVREDVLVAAARSARRSNVTAASALIADGGVSEQLFFFSLSRYLGLDFVRDWPRLAESADAATALRLGRVPLADGRWLAAPKDGSVRLLLVAAKRADLLMPRLAITTPAHFAAIISRCLSHQIADVASSALPDSSPCLSARGALSWKKGLICLLVGAFCVGGLVAGQRVAVDVVSAMFCAALIFRLLVSAAGLAADPQPGVELRDALAPTYSVLVPLYQEAAMVSGLFANLQALDYPRAKLEILFLTEVDDSATRLALAAEALPPHMRIVVVPDGQPRTKPRALNAGLLHARGSFVTVYDAEDRPDPDQLRRAASRFRQGPPELACLQARLAIPEAASLLQHLFAIEYAALFDLYNVGAARLNLPIPIGGTSNHFRVSVLRKVGGWDAFNVTEDADLGLRLARFGYIVGDLGSTTAESAEASPARWFNQRRRWTKGWMQTTLVLLRVRAMREFGFCRSVVVALMLTNLVIGPLLAPIAIALLTYDLARFGLPHPSCALELCETTLAGSVLALGAVTPLWCGYAGMRVRGLRAIASLPALLPYQLMICAAAWGGLVDLLRQPYHWRKTPHTVPPRR